MRSRILSYSFLIFISLVLSPLSFSQEKSFSLLSRLPGKTLAVASFPNVAQLRQDFPQTSFGRFCQEPEIRALLDSLLTPYRPQIEMGISQAEQHIGMSLSDALGIFSGEVSLAIVEFDPHNGQMPLGAVFSLHYGSHKKQMDHFLQMFQELEDISFTSSDGSIYTSDQVPVCYTLIDGSLVISTRVELLQSIVDENFSSQDLLVASENFQKAQERVQTSKTPVFFFYLSTTQVYQQLPIPPQAHGMMDALGLLEIQSLALGMDVDDEHIGSHLWLQTSENRHGLLNLADLGSLPSDLAKEVPASAVTFSAINFDFGDFLNKLEFTLKATMPPAAQQLEQGMEQVSQILGFSLRNDFFASLGSLAYSFSYMPPQGGLIPRSASVLHLRDAQLFASCLDKLIARIGMEKKQISFFEQEVTYLLTPLGQLGSNPFGEMENGSNPIQGILSVLTIGYSGTAFLFENDKFYFFPSLQEAKGFLRERKGGTENLTQNPDFQNLQARISSQSSILFYFDGRKIFSSWWNTLFPVLRSFEGFIRKAGIPLETALIPETETLSKYLPPSCLTYSSDAQGIYFSSYSSMIIGPPTLVAVVGIVSAIAIPSFLKARGQAQESATLATLRALSTSQVMAQQSLVVDQDSDGYGEYCFIQELAGLVTPRNGEPLDYPFIDFDKVLPNGVFEKNGYYFYCYLPGDPDQGESAGEIPVTTDADMIDAQEQCYVIYAWPVKFGETGTKAFVINQVGEILVTDDHYYDGSNIPSSTAAYNDYSIAAGDFADNDYGNDGNFWYIYGQDYDREYGDSMSKEPAEYDEKYEESQEAEYYDDAKEAEAEYAKDYDTKETEAEYLEDGEDGEDGDEDEDEEDED